MIKGILARWSPPLAPSQIDAIAEVLMGEWDKAEKTLKSELKTKSKSLAVTGRRGRTR
jgi:hypothetical protein